MMTVTASGTTFVFFFFFYTRPPPVARLYSMSSASLFLMPPSFSFFL